MELIVILLCVVSLVIVVAVSGRDCPEVCGELGMVHIEKSHGCAVACLCGPEGEL
jgi:hypothetical protein